MYRLSQTLQADINYNQQLIEKFKKGEISGAQLKANRVPMGVYEQRQDGRYMLRVRCVGGLITPQQLREASKVAQKINASHIHITTRQEIQIHDVALDDITPSLNTLKDAELSTQGGGGNTIRNMLVNEKSGISSTEVFDVYPYAVELTSRLIAEKDSWSMPRKLKIAFDINEQDADFALVADLGFIPKIQNNQRGFKVLLGGSVASNPHKGWVAFDFLNEKDLFRAAKAAKNFFNLNGNRKNRYKARIRYIFYKNGEEDTLKLFYEEFNKLKDDKSLDFEPAVLNISYKTPDFEPINNTSKEFKIWKNRYAKKQTNAESNLFSVIIPVVNGNISNNTFEKIADFLDNFGQDVIRFTPRQNIQIRNIKEEYLGNIYEFFKNLGFELDLPVTINNIVSCTGADTCRLGICLPKGLEKAIAKRLKNSKLKLDEIPAIKININGCPNSCAQSAWSDLGFSGRIGRKGDYPYPAYNIWLRTSGNKELAENQGFLSARDIPEFVEKFLAKYISQKANFKDYNDFVIKNGAKTVKEILSSFTEVPEFEDDKNYYFDWGAKALFSLSRSSQAECSAGLFDIIELDQQTIKDKQKEYLNSETNKEKLLNEIVFSASRMLLVTRGADPRTDKEVYENFENLFIKAGLVSQKYLPIIEKAKQKSTLLEYKDLIDSLVSTVNKLYESMDDSLQFKNIENIKKEEPAKTQQVAENNDVVKRDFRGVACPMNFVKTKVVLATIPQGGLLEILLDDGQPIKNVPGSVRLEGHEVLETENLGSYWRVLIKKH